MKFWKTIQELKLKSGRFIGSLRRVYNYNRTTTDLQRLENWSLLSIESDVLETISNDNAKYAIELFSTSKARKLILYS